MRNPLTVIPVTSASPRNTELVERGPVYAEILGHAVFPLGHKLNEVA